MSINFTFLERKKKKKKKKSLNRLRVRRLHLSDSRYSSPHHRLGVYPPFVSLGVAVTGRNICINPEFRVK
ncbi:hypothetical protein LWI28_002585 [Acer negundo]|uniref:Uncharacterized protein n=1 Tax=Acer negundo TaxID=4023 RepID=A0AAD5NPM7_ACENE|nr:hypothetical protein LWI28_002585 [Acer negundo]